MIQINQEFYQGQDTYRIVTPIATYLLHRQSGGLAGLLDAEGNDWISYRPHGGSDGKYRGIPNLKYPDGYFHPGSVNASTEIITTNAAACRIRVVTLDGVCEGVWEFTAHTAQFTLLQGPQSYWMLYEGTPGGRLDELEGSVTRSDGTRTNLGEKWDAVLDPGWVYFQTPSSRSVLFLAQVSPELKCSTYWPMEHHMTVFGFGRQGIEHLLTRVPACFLMGFLRVDEHPALREKINTLLSAHIQIDETKPRVSLGALHD
jgi:hypothetical protein